MNLLPIAQRELRLASRQSWMYWSRCLVAAGAAAVSFNLVFADMSGAVSAGTASQTVFVVLSAMAYAYVCLSGSFLVSDCLSREKREGTLGLLFLTDLKSLDIIAGKLASRLTRTASLLLAAIPATSFVLALGGVSVADYFLMTLALGNALFFSASVSMLVSACSWKDYRSIGGGAGLALVLCGLVPAWGFVIAPATGIPPAWTLALGPGGAFLAALGPGIIALPRGVFVASFLISQAMAWGCLATACYWLPRTVKRTPRIEPVTAPIKRAVNEAEALSPLRPESPPVLRVLGRGKGRWTAAVLLPMAALFGLCLLIWFSPTGWGEPVFLGALIVVLHTALKFKTAQRACRALDQNRQSGELELLLTTPLHEEDILRGYMLGLKREMLPELLGVLATDLVIIAAGCVANNRVEWVLLAMAFCVETVWLLVNLYSLAWVGFFFGLRSPGAALAIERSLAAVVLAPWLGAAMIGGAIAALCGVFASYDLGPAMGFAVGSLPVGIIACNLGFTGWAFNELRDRFREMASHQFIADKTGPKQSLRQWLRQFFLLEPR